MSSNLAGRRDESRGLSRNLAGLIQVSVRVRRSRGSVRPWLRPRLILVKHHLQNINQSTRRGRGTDEEEEPLQSDCRQADVRLARNSDYSDRHLRLCAAKLSRYPHRPGPGRELCPAPRKLSPASGGGHGQREGVHHPHHNLSGPGQLRRDLQHDRVLLPALLQRRRGHPRPHDVRRRVVPARHEVRQGHPERIQLD